MKQNKKILVVASHPDDEVLGCGGTLIKYSKMDYQIKVIFMTNGVSSRSKKKKEEILKRKKAALKSCKILGASKPKFFDFKDNQMDSVPLLKIVKKIEKEIFTFKPLIIFTHFDGDLNIDHEITSRATVTACRPMTKNPVKNLYMFYVPSSTEWNFKKNKKNFVPNWFEDISKSDKQKKLALNCYKMEMRKWPHPRSLKNIANLQEVFASEVGQKKTESFILYRGLN